MNEFIRIHSCLINTAEIRCIQLEENLIIVHYTDGKFNKLEYNDNFTAELCFNNLSLP